MATLEYYQAAKRSFNSKLVGPKPRAYDLQNRATEAR